MIDLGTGNNNKINWAIPDKQEVIDIIETVYRGARKGRMCSLRWAAVRMTLRGLCDESRVERTPARRRGNPSFTELDIFDYVTRRV